MSTIKANSIENLAGTSSILVEDIAPIPTDGKWAGTAIADEQALRDFYGNQTITVQGANFSAKSFPDGSVVGSTDNGSFEMSANGGLEMRTYAVGLSGTSAWGFPIKAVGVTSTSDTLFTGNVLRSSTLSPWFVSFRSPLNTQIVFNVYDNTGTVVDSAACRLGYFGRWK